MSENWPHILITLSNLRNIGLIREGYEETFEAFTRIGIALDLYAWGIVEELDGRVI